MEIVRYDVDFIADVKLLRVIQQDQTGCDDMPIAGIHGARHPRQYCGVVVPKDLVFGDGSLEAGQSPSCLGLVDRCLLGGNGRCGSTLPGNDLRPIAQELRLDVEGPLRGKQALQAQIEKYVGKTRRQQGIVIEERMGNAAGG